MLEWFLCLSRNYWIQKMGKGGLVSYAVKTPSGKMKGTLSFSYNLGEKFNAPAPEKAKKMDEHVAGANTAKGYHEPVTAYPAMGYHGGPGSSSAYPPPPPQAAHQGPYPYPYQHPPPPQQGYGGYPPAPGSWVSGLSTTARVRRVSTTARVWRVSTSDATTEA
ncbi:PROTEIN SRC2-like protein [Salix purpurea]|uniref:PROTEIN SRC2-like protein n=1 Tax=Salix purpurea TaxID=77065 RepID=A0A9Q0W8M3_SALPP|nr:PROTEIN SRC2-like protein [Salix purpurea]